MYSVSRWMRESLVLVSLLVRCIGAATNALIVTPSTNWYGDDGTWSAVSIRVGTPPQWVDVTVNTLSSETWIVGPGGCYQNNSICQTDRGQIFDLTQSSTWQEEGLFNLGVDNRLGGHGYAEYGEDNLTFGSTGVTLQNAIIGSINTTEFFVGSFGLGVVPGNFHNITSLAAISGLVEKNGAIPSHSYGYTAGAKYQQKGEPNSLTLGGYDANRFVPHNVSYNLNPSQNPQAYISYISVQSAGTSNNWTTPVQLLSTADRVSAIIDSSTPYLWFPQAVCDRFASSLGLTYNDTLNLYTFDGNASQRTTLGNSQLSFTFSLSDVASSPQTVNITLPYEAFDLQLTFPAIPNTTFGAANAAKYYFPLKRATSDAQYTIGRAFLQEAYLITDYERNTFSIHQAVHTADPIGNVSIVSILRPGDSTFSSPPASKSKSKSKSGIAAGAIAGIAIGATIALALFGFIIFRFYRRKQKKELLDDEKPIETTQRRSFLGRFRRRPQGGGPPVNEAVGSTGYPTEVGADAEHERFELPAPLGPAELDSEAGTLDGTTERGSSTSDSNNISAYERARRKLERQQAGALEAQPMHEAYPVEKNDNDTSPVTHYIPPDSSETLESQTPLVSPVGPSSGDSLTVSGQPSPVSPRFVSGPTSPTSPPPTYRRLSPGNVVYAGRLPDNVQLPAVVPRIIGRDGRTVEREETLITEPGSPSEGTASTLGSRFTENEAATLNEDIYGSGSPIVDRTPYSPVSVSAQSNASGSVSAIGSGSVTGQGSHTSGVSALSPSANSSQAHIAPPINIRGGFGASGRVIEEDESKFLREDMVTLRADMQTREILDPYKGRRRLTDGGELVHVPQPAENRFSWEEDRISGNEGESSGTK